MPITHAFVHPDPDDPDSSQVRPSDWNADHVGGVEDALPIADPTDVVIDDTTYDNTWTGSSDDKYTTAVFPTGGVAVAWAQSGDAFPRVLMMANPLDGFYWADGTVNPFNAGAAWWIGGPDANGNFSQTIEGGRGANQRAVFGDLDTNAGYGTSFLGAGNFRIGVEGGLGAATSFTLSAGEDVPAIGGNVGDIYIRQDPGGANQTLYRCTVAGTAGSATWVGMGGGDLPDPATFPRASYSGNAVNVTDGNESLALLTWDTLGFGDALLDLTDPTQPTVIDSGIYSVTASVTVDQLLTTGGMFLAVLHLGMDDEDAVSEMTNGAQVGGAHAITAITSLNNTYYIPAGGVIGVSINNRDGAATRPFRLREAIVQLVVPVP